MPDTNLQDDENDRQNSGAEQRFQMHGLDLSADPLELNGVGDGLGSGIRIAQTARPKPDSRLVARLKVAERGQPERRETRRPPDVGRAQDDECRGQQGGYPECDDAKSEPVPPATRADVGNRGNG
jgi:hypothetical protein